MLRIKDFLPTKEECLNNNKSIFLEGFDFCTTYLHNIVSELNMDTKILLFNREIDEDTMEVLKKIISCNQKQSNYSYINLYCCRNKNSIDFNNLKQDPLLKDISIYLHPQKDFFHDRFIYIISKKDSIEDIYLMGNSLSSIKKMPMSLVQIVGNCINYFDNETKDRLIKYLNMIKDKSNIIYSKEINE